MANLVTLAQAKTHLGETGSARDAIIQQKLDAAEPIVLRYIKHADVSGSRKIVEAAILVTMTELLDFRGDNGGPESELGGVSRHVRYILGDLREPTIA
jgi:hypothetical protein